MSIDEKTNSMSEHLNSGEYLNEFSNSAFELQNESHTHTGTKTVYLPTYKMRPDPDSTFHKSTVHKLANDVLFNQLSGIGYEEKEAKRLCPSIADEIKRKIRNTSISKRYKIIVQVTIGEMKRQAVRCTSRCLWDKDTDNYTTVNYQNETLWAVATIFGLYTE